MPLDNMLLLAPPGGDLCLDHVDGVTVVGDVHGMDCELRPILRQARERNRLTVLLGDIVNRGTSSLRCMEMVLDGVANGEVVLIPGNHEQRLLMMVRTPSRLDSDPRYQDNNALAKLRGEVEQSPMGQELVEAFANLIGALPLWRRYGGATFCHASMPVGLRGQAAPLLGDVSRGVDSGIDAVMWGERHGGFGPISYEWVNAIPADEIVLIGHHPHSRRHPVRRRGRPGGAVICMDTGAGGMGDRPPGRLSSLDLDHHQLRMPHTARPLLGMPVVHLAVD